MDISNYRKPGEIKFISSGETSASKDENAFFAGNITPPSAEMSFDVGREINYDVLKALRVGMYQSSEISFEYDFPIMIQARWHKKRRIRKKWLKRYGMKPDRLHAVVSRAHYNGWAIEFRTSDVCYKYRPDQLRHGIKIVR